MAIPTPRPNNGVIITVSDWNAFFSPPSTYGQEAQISPLKWHYRLPFYAKILGQNSAEVRDDNQETIDKEIQFAAAAGINSISFFWWDFQGLSPRPAHPNLGDMNHPLRYYLSSPYKKSIYFSITSELYHMDLDKDITKWDTSFTPHMVEFMKDPQYQKVLGGRPIIYFMGVKDSKVLPVFGSDQAFKDALQRFRTKAQQAGLQNPYIVDLSGEKDLTTRLGMDAVSEYTTQYGTGQGFNNGNPWPYSDLVRSNTTIWNRRATEGVPFIPNLNVGWDYRPSPDAAGYGNSPVFANATPQEIATHISNAVSWIKSHQSTVPTQTLYIYAWAENGEGGFLTPTLYGGDARLQEISKVLTGSPFTSPRFKGRDLNGDNKIDISDYNILLRDFGRSIDPIPLDADITGDGHVDIDDYNKLVEMFNK